MAELDKYKALARKLANPVDLIELKSRVDKLYNKYGNANLKIEDGRLVCKVKNEQEIMICYDHELYYNLVDVVNQENQP